MISDKKTKAMACGRNKSVVTNIILIFQYGEEFKQVQQCCYLGNTITEDGRNKKEIIRKIFKQRESFTIESHLTSCKMSFSELLLRSLSKHMCVVWYYVNVRPRPLKLEKKED